jgi:hypothetical protein
MKKTLGLSLLVVAMCVSTSSASMLVNCNFGSSAPNGNADVGTGQYGLLGTNKDIWNNLYPGSSNVSLKDSTGASSGLTMTQDMNSAWYNDNYTFTGPFAILKGYNNLGSGKTTGTLTLSGFTGGTYDLYIYDAFQWVSSYTTYTINGTSQKISNNPVTVSSFVVGTNYVVFEDVTPVNGQVVITLDATTVSGNICGSICALQLVAVPEPATMVLLAIGSFWLRRRK